MTEEDKPATSAAERWFEEQQAWQKTMRDYADAMAKDEQFLTHLGNAMRGSLLAGAPYPEAPPPGTGIASDVSADRLEEVLFVLKRIEGRLRDLEDAVGALTLPATPPTHSVPAEPPAQSAPAGPPAPSAPAGTPAQSAPAAPPTPSAPAASPTPSAPAAPPAQRAPAARRQPKK